MVFEITVAKFVAQLRSINFSFLEELRKWSGFYL